MKAISSHVDATLDPLTSFSNIVDGVIPIECSPNSIYACCTARSNGNMIAYTDQRHYLPELLFA